MAVPRQRLVADLLSLGLRPGTIVMIHASLRAIGPVYGGPDEVHLAVQDACAPGGTVMMYVGCQDGFDDVGRGAYSAAEEAAILAHQPAFDPQVARAARDFGALAEMFRSYPGTVCSGAVDGRVAARGARAAWLVADQPLDYDVGKGSPFEKLCEAEGDVLLLGSSHDEVTLLHYAEHVADIPDRRIVRFQVPLLVEGRRVWRTCEQYDTSGAAHASWPPDFFARIVQAFVRRHSGTPACSTGKVGNADSVRCNAHALAQHAIAVMEARAAGNDVP